MEAAVKITKTMMCTALRDGTDQYEALLELRDTPRQDTGISPAEMMFGKILDYCYRLQEPSTPQVRNKL